MLKLREIPLRASIATFALLLLAGCTEGGHVSSGTLGSGEPADSPVRYVKVELRAVPAMLDLAATVQPDPTKVVRIFPPASGRVVAISVEPGENVRRGQAVAVLDSSDVASARSDFAKANIEAERATREMQRQKVLYEHGAASEQDYANTQAQAASARAELARARQRLELLNVSPSATSDRVSLLSPGSGIVLSVKAAPGEFSLDSSNPLVTIANLNNVWIVGDVYEKDIAKVARGDQATITLDAYPGRQWNGRIDSVSGVLDPATRTLKVRVALANPGQHLKPDMFGAIHVRTGARQALVVPAAAVIREGNNTMVFVNHAGKPEQRSVTVGRALDGSVEIVSGLGAGEEVAADGAELLTGGPGE